MRKQRGVSEGRENRRKCGQNIEVSAGIKGQKKVSKLKFGKFE